MMAGPRSVLVVCAGNICRSPIGAALLAAALPSVTITSAGLTPVTGHDVDPAARRVAEAAGLFVPPHRAKPLDLQLLTQHELVLVMDPDQRREVLRRHPQTTGRVWLFSAWTVPTGIPDPYRCSEDFYFEVHRLLVAAAESWIPRLRGK